MHCGSEGQRAEGEGLCADKKTSHTHGSFWKTIFYCLSKSINSMFIIETPKQ